MKPRVEMGQYFHDRGNKHKTKSLRLLKKRVRRKIKKTEKRNFWRHLWKFMGDL